MGTSFFKICRRSKIKLQKNNYKSRLTKPRLFCIILMIGGDEMILIIMVCSVFAVLGISCFIYRFTHKGSGLQDLPEKIPMPKRK